MLDKAPAIDGQQWIAVTVTKADALERLEASTFALNFRYVEEDTGDVERFHVVLSRSGQEPVRIDPKMAAWAYVTPDSRYVFLEPLDVLDVKTWKVFSLSGTLGIRNFASIAAISRDGRRLLVSRVDCPMDCRGDVLTEYFEVVFPR